MESTTAVVIDINAIVERLEKGEVIKLKKEFGNNSETVKKQLIGRMGTKIEFKRGRNGGVKIKS